MVVDMLTGDFRYSDSEHRYWLEQADQSQWDLPGTSRIIQSTGRVNPRFMTEEGRDRGSAIHHLTYLLDLGQCRIEDITGEFRPWCNGYEQFRIDHNFPTWELREECVYNPELGFATTLDCAGMFQGRPTILNIKTGSSMPSYEVVRAGEVLAYYGYRAPVARLTLYITKRGSYKLEEHRNPRDFDEFLNDLSEWRKGCHSPQRNGPLGKLLPLNNRLVLVPKKELVSSYRAVETEIGALHRQAKEITALVARFAKWGRSAEALATVEVRGIAVAIAIQDAAQERHAVAVFREGKEVQKELADLFKPVEAAIFGFGKAKKVWKDTPVTMLGRINAGLVQYRERVAEEARKAARAEARREEEARQAEEKRLRDAAKLAKGAEKKELLADAREVAEQEIDPEEAAERAEKATLDQFRGAGHAPMRQLPNKALVENLAALICAVVASDPVLLEATGKMAEQYRRGQLVDVPGINALEANLPELNRRARANDSLDIPGVVVELGGKTVANV